MMIKRGRSSGHRHERGVFVGSGYRSQGRLWARGSRRFCLADGNVGFRFHTSLGCHP